jgi:hypothetical protein
MNRAMMRFVLGSLLPLLLFTTANANAKSTIQERTDGLQPLPGFYHLYWDADSGSLLLEIDRFGEDFLYQTSMPRGVGSNDLGLDRGQLGSTQVTRFYRSGAKVLLVTDNLGYRADEANPLEYEAVQQSFAESVLWGFTVEAEGEDAVLVDATDFFLRDSHGLSMRLARAKQGTYSVDTSRSAIFLPRTRSFPDNTEIEAVVTFTGKPNYDGPGEHVLSTVVPDPTAVTVHLHHSFIRLPDDGFEPVPFDPRSGYISSPGWGEGFLDFSSEIGEPMRVQFARKHRLEKKDPTAELSEAVEPIIYYLDPGVPEPVRSALLEGASWWNQAFEYAGYKDAFQVRLLPEDADPMDVRYNVIQWVHRSTRGWSYGSSIVDPRTGEILKGHVSLGSLRVRQDYLIAEGLLSPYAGEEYSDAMLNMSLARIRQLSAHEVGHTIGLEHNFAASVNDRASVMDYPFPLIRFDDNGQIDLSQAYGVGIGDWDKRTILWGYQDFPEGVDAGQARSDILDETLKSGLLYVSDEDSRNVGTAHAQGNLWDNGADAVDELEHLKKIRAHALDRFSLNTIRMGRPTATLEEVLVPLYLLHRFQIQAAGKWLGGQYFGYNLRGDGQALPTAVTPAEQRRAMTALLDTLSADFLLLPETVTDLITPRPPGNPLDRETFARQTGPVFDPLGPAAASARLTLDVLLHPQRLARMNRQRLADPRLPDAGVLLDTVFAATWRMERGGGMAGAIQRQTGQQVLDRVAAMVNQPDLGADIRAQAMHAVMSLDEWLGNQSRRRLDTDWDRHYAQARRDVRAVLNTPTEYTPSPPPKAPPGSPIGG